MSSSGGLEVLNTPEKLDVRPAKRHTWPPEPEPPETLSLSRTGLTHVADCILKNSTLKYLYLEGNHISAIPQSFFTSLPRLLWLDLRNNQIASLPAQIGAHGSLKTLLLEGNPISELPPELGYVTTLGGLNLRDCPITFPPPDVVSRGVQNILQYLRGTMAKRPLSVRTTPPLELPVVVEKLRLSESSGEEQELVDDEELQRFRELKHKMILLDEAELGSAAPRNNRRLFPATTRKKAAGGAGLIPELPLFGSLRLKEQARRQTGKKARLPEHRRRYPEAPHNWCTESKITQERGMCTPWEPEKPSKREEVQTDLTPSASGVVGRPPEQEKARSARAPEQQIRSLVYGMQEGSGDPRGTSARQMALAERGAKEMRGLRARPPEKKHRRRSEGCVSAADARRRGDVPPHAPSSK